jgi:hypothetical protein
MLIKNENLAGTLLRMPSGKTQQGSSKGVFDVSEEDGKMLIETPGWTMTTKAELDAEKAQHGKAKSEAAAAEKADKTVHPAPSVDPGEGKPADQPATPPPPAKDDKGNLTPTEPPPVAETETTEEETPDAEETEGPDLPSMTKAQLIEVAAEYGVELTAAQKNGKVDELRAYLDQEIYGDSEPE